jgi:colanic acid/amylovoran biosynthesis glycosyltransferase
VHILYVTSSLPYGPGEAFVIPEVAALRRRGHEITIAPMFGRGPVLHDDARSLLASTLDGSLLSGDIVRGAGRRLARSPGRSLRAGRLLLGSRNPKILANNLAVLPKGLWLGLQAERLGVDHIHAHWGATSATMALIASELSGIPWSVTLHRFDIDEDNLLATKASRASFMRAIDDIGLQKLRVATRGRARDAFVLHMGVDVSPERAAAAENGRVLAAASLREVKGHVYLLDAVRLLRERGVDVHLDCVGDGPLRADLERYVDEHELGETVSLKPALSHRELLDRLASGRWTASVLASVVTADGAHEGIPVSLLEAMSLGIPVIGTETGGIPAQLRDGAGLLVPERDAAALAGALERVLTDAELRSRLADAGRRRVEEQFDVEVIAAELERRFAAATRDGS